MPDVGPLEALLRLRHLSEAGTAECAAARQYGIWYTLFVVEFLYWVPTRRLKRYRAPDLDVDPAQADPALIWQNR